MNELPLGTVTFLFTDIQGSTPLWERDPDRMSAALQIHHALLNKVIINHGGVVFKVIGDEFNAAFPTASQALRAAIEGQRELLTANWNELGPLKVRMGVHTGEADPDSGGKEYLSSHTLNRVSRILSAAHGGQILLSQECATLTQRSLPEGTSLIDLGEYYLKGLLKAEHIFQAAARGLKTKFPPLEASTTQLHNLPVQIKSFIGRTKELDEVSQLLSTHRMVTLTGTGGTGKSRLSLQVAVEQLDAFSNGIWLVELASLSDPAMVPKAVASVLNLPEMPEKPDLEILVDFLKPKCLMLILDNCEHLLDACAMLVEAILRSCPEITILATSREVLGVAGESTYRVPGMALPDKHQLLLPENLSNYDAVQMFVARAQSVSPDFTITRSNAALVMEVVNRLDGIPLAIELAAARMHVLGIEQIAQRLKDTFRILTSGGRTELPHHQTLRASMDWSYDLLSEAECALLRRLSVFVGGWKLQAAEEVCANGYNSHVSFSGEDVLDLLSDLVDKSLVMVSEESEGRNRYQMLKTIRQYAHEKLVLAGEEEIINERMLAYYLDLVDALKPRLRGREQIQTLERLEVEIDNLRSALEWALHKDVKQQNDVMAALKLASHLQWFWHIHFHWSEGIDWLEQALKAETRLPEKVREENKLLLLRARALRALGFHRLMQYLQNTPTLDQAKTALEESLVLYQRNIVDQEPEALRGQAWALVWLATCFFKGGSLSEASGMVEKALDLFRETGEAHGIAESLQLLGDMEKDPVRRKTIYQEQLEIEEANGDIDGIANALYHMGDAASNDGDFESACTAFEASREHYRRVNDPIMVAMSWLALGIASFSKGDLQRADQGLQESLAIFSELGYENRMPFSLFFICLLRIAEGKYDQATEANERAWHIYQKTGIQPIAADVVYARARLARLGGELDLAEQYALELRGYSGEDHPQGMLSNLELGHLALQNGDLDRAGRLWREGVQFLMRKRETGWVFAFLDGLAFLAAKARKHEHAARMCGTRWCRSYSHFLSPLERAMREECLSEMIVKLGDMRYHQLTEEGNRMSFEQAVNYAQELIIV